MLFDSFIKTFADYILFTACLLILAGSIFITIKMRFVQVRFFPVLFKTLFASLTQRKQSENNHTIPPHKALFAAMSTTLGISTIVAPVIAIQLGGPGALFGFLLTAFFGSAATYTEVSLSVKHRKTLADGVIMGGPMQYLKHLISAKAAKWYALSCMLLMCAWSGAQANQLAAIFDSPMLGSYRVPTLLSGVVFAILVLVALLGGIKRIGAFSAKLVPIMFLLYVGSSIWILLINSDKIGTIFQEMFHSALHPYALANGAVVGGVVSALRWGIFKGTQASEAGIGTQAIPHAMAETQDPIAQGTLAMFSTYTAGLVAFLSGCVTLVTKTWQDPSLPLGISMVTASFERYFSYFGIAIVVISTLLFGFGTILGNSYNGSQCYAYLTQNKKKGFFLAATACMIVIGAITEVKTFWSFVDLILAGMALPHIAALALYAHRQPKTTLNPVVDN